MEGIWKYHELLPQVATASRLSLGEGATPLVKSKHIGRALGIDNLYFKLENLNPTGSYKDRFAALALSDMLQRDNSFCIATSSGNTGAALAAYCAAARIKCIMAVVDGAPQGKLQQMQLYGAATLMVRDFGIDREKTDSIMASLNQLAAQHQTLVQISAYRYSPFGMQGVQTIAYELAETLGQPADVLVPAGGGGLTLAVARGFAVWEDKHHVSPTRIHCVQPRGNDTIASALAQGSNQAAAVAVSQTRISGLQVPNVLDGTDVVHACRKSGGTGIVVNDELVWEYQHKLATLEGIFCEPAGAVALAGAVESIRSGRLTGDRPIVCIITGHGFKDLRSAERIANESTNAFLDNENALVDVINKMIKNKA